MPGCWHRAVLSLTTPRPQGGVAVFDAAARWTGARWLVERKHRCQVNHCEIVGSRGRREGKRVLCHAGFHALSSSSSSFENEGDGQTGVAALREFVDKNYIPIALLCAAMLGWVFPKPGEIAVSYKLQKLSTIGQFVISGLVLRASQVVAAVKSPFPVLYGAVSILLMSPFLGMGLMSLPVEPFEYKIGMAVFCCVPTTLSSCVALTNACNGNAAIALMLVVLTNTLGVFTIPPMLTHVLGSSSISGSFNQSDMLRSLVMTVLVPLMIGSVLQRIPDVSRWKDANRKLLSRMSTLFLCLTPWMQLSIASAAQLAIGPVMILTGIALGIGVHMVFLIFNMLVTRTFVFNKDPKENRAIKRAVILCTSEKTLPVAVAVMSQLGGLGSAMAYAVLPCIFSHIIQAVIDSALVSQWNKEDEMTLHAS